MRWWKPSKEIFHLNKLFYAHRKIKSREIIQWLKIVINPANVKAILNQWTKLLFTHWRQCKQNHFWKFFELGVCMLLKSVLYVGMQGFFESYACQDSHKRNYYWCIQQPGTRSGWQNRHFFSLFICKVRTHVNREKKQLSIIWTNVFTELCRLALWTTSFFVSIWKY